MKKIISLFLACIMSLSFVACGEISPATNDDTNKKPTKIEYEKYDITTESGLRKALTHAPDNNAADGFWQYWVEDTNSTGLTKFLTWNSRLPGYKEDIESIKGSNGGYGFEYGYQIDELRSLEYNTAEGTDEDYLAFVSKYQTLIPIDKFFEKLGLFTAEEILAERNENKDIIFSESQLFELNIVGDEIIPLLEAENQWQKITQDWVAEEDMLAADVMRGDFNNINHANDWFKYQGLYYDEDSFEEFMSDSFGWQKEHGRKHPFATKEEGYKCLELYEMFRDMSVNYIEAKFLGTELTTKLSDDFAKVVDFDEVNRYFEYQGIDLENYDFEITSDVVNFFQSFPTVGITYKLTDKTTGVEGMSHSIFVYRTVELENGYDYEIDYIIDFYDSDVMNNSFWQEVYDHVGRIYPKWLETYLEK